MKGYQNAKIGLKMEIFIAYTCLKINENGSFYCITSSFYSIYLSKSLLKSVTPIKKREGAPIGGGGRLMEKNMVNEMNVSGVVVGF